MQIVRCGMSCPHPPPPTPLLQLTERDLFTPGTSVTLTNWLGMCMTPCTGSQQFALRAAAMATRHCHAAFDCLSGLPPDAGCS